jgi:hypothetical protein
VSLSSATKARAPSDDTAPSAFHDPCSSGSISACQIRIFHDHECMTLVILANLVQYDSFGSKDTSRVWQPGL